MSLTTLVIAGKLSKGFRKLSYKSLVAVFLMIPKMPMVFLLKKLLLLNQVPGSDNFP